MVKEGVWRNGKRILKGTWEYIWASDKFVIRLDSRDRVTGANRVIVTSNNTPTWGNWKLEELGG